MVIGRVMSGLGVEQIGSTRVSVAVAPSTSIYQKKDKMKLTIGDPKTNRCIFIDSEDSKVLITEAYIGPQFVTDAGEELHVCMRDVGFDITYVDSWDVEHHYSLNDGVVRRTSVSIRGRKNKDDNLVPTTED